MYDDPQVKLDALKRVDDALAFDAIQVAEDIAGKGTPAAQGLGLLLHLNKCEQEKSLMESLGDSSFGMDFFKYLALAKSLGFKEIYSETFGPNNDQLKIFWRNGILLIVESYGMDSGKPSTSSASLYFQYRYKFPKEYDKHIQCSGGWTNKSRADFNEQCEVPIIQPLRDQFAAKGEAYSNEAIKLYNKTEGEWLETSGFVPILEGHHDVRVGLKHELTKIEMFCDVLPEWVECRFIWLLNYFETNSDEYKSDHDAHFAISLRKMKKFPEEIQKAICIQDIEARVEETTARKK